MRAKRSIEDLLNRIQGVREQLKDYNLAPDHVKRDTRLYAMREAAELIGRSDQTIRDAEADGRLATPEIGPNGKRVGYTLAQINDARDVLGTRLKRATDEEPVVIGCQSFKGGSGKTTTAVHLTQYLARQGLRVLLVDCDPQASATAIFGYVPEADLSPDETLLPFLEGDRDDLVYSVRATYFDGVYLVPSNLHLYRSEYTLASGTAKLDRLKEGIDTIAAGFDVVVIDPPPSLGMISLNALYASNALIIPMSLGLLDFYSTVSFIQMLNETLDVIEQRVGIFRSKFVKVLMTRVNEGKPVHIQLADHLQASFGTYLMKARMHDSAAVDNAGVMMRTVYELDKTSANRKTLIRATMLFDLVNAEILSLIRATWPSHHKALRAQGLM
ncbi:AAA family ATPase [Lamprocystis purpurea]|jgi:chromosome partitioning protein|uniref:AAA family ATPase n=1 Tax=Lamprocystis purpurea TaxID=61598 RepID=UPI0003644847|nr:AAA family ATPase [Lamprocystis purpurea]